MSVNKESSPNFDELSQKAVCSLLSHLALVEDPRGRQGSLHIFSDILAIIVLGTLCGCDDAEKLDEWAEKEESWLSTFLQLPYGTPSQDTFLRALAAMEPKSFSSAFRHWAQELFKLLGLEGQVAVDGKTVRGARLTNQSKSPVHIVSALACEHGLVLGQIRTREKSNEITAMPELLKMLFLEGMLVSSDAMGCQTDIAQTIIEGKGDYLFGLKGNQPTLLTEAEELFREADDPRMRALDEHKRPVIALEEQVDGGHGRIEVRRATVCYEFNDWVPTATRFPELKTLIRIQSTVEKKSTGKVKKESRYYISSRLMTASQANQAVRAHWLIENQLHWCLDVTFGEDACRIRTKNAAENMTTIRHFALSLLRLYKGDRLSIRRRRCRCDYNMDYRMRVLGAVVS